MQTTRPLTTLGQNPRKDITHTWDYVQAELCDVMFIAMVALRTLTPDAPKSSTPTLPASPDGPSTPPTRAKVRDTCETRQPTGHSADPKPLPVLSLPPAMNHIRQLTVTVTPSRDCALNRVICRAAGAATNRSSCAQNRR